MALTATDLRILIIADDPLARAGLAALLAPQPGLAVVGQVAAVADLQSSLAVYQPDAVVWDLGWEPRLALERLADLPQDTPPVLALLPDEAHAAAAWAAGIRGLLLREAGAASLRAALVALGQGLAVMDPAVAVLLPATRGQTAPLPGVELTPRELEVLRLLAEGLTNKAIAARLSISEHTVKFHVNAILGKLGAQSRTEAVTRATRLGLVLL